jgi:uridine phosphorylase
METTYHICITKKELKGATIALITGDPARVPTIAKKFSENSHELAWNREFRSYLTYCNQCPVLIISHGIGGPSTAILMEEICSLGIQTVIRVGTSGAIQDFIQVGDIIISSAAVRLDGTSKQYAPVEYPASASPEIVMLLKKSAQELKIPYHVGITASTDSFYPGQERYDSFFGYVQKSLQGSSAEWTKLRVLNYEMESSTVFTLGNLFGIQTGCVTGVVDNRDHGEDIDTKAKPLAIDRAIQVAKLAIKKVLSQTSG